MVVSVPRLLRPGLLLLLFLPLVAASHAHGAEIPDLIFDPTQPEIPPIWVSAEVALDTQGKLRSDYLGQLQYFWDLHSARGNIAADGCLVQGAVYNDSLPHQAPVRTLAKLNGFSWTVVRGTVSDLKPGFCQQQAGVLLRLDPVEILSGTLSAQDAPLFIYYPNARFSIGSYSFCKIDPRASHEPRPGDEFLIFVRTLAAGPERRLIAPQPEDLFIETENGELLVPAPLRDDPVVAVASSLEDIIAAISAKGAEP